MDFLKAGQTIWKDTVSQKGKNPRTNTRTKFQKPLYGPAPANSYEQQTQELDNISFLLTQWLDGNVQGFRSRYETAIQSVFMDLNSYEDFHDSAHEILHIISLRSCKSKHLHIAHSLIPY